MNVLVKETAFACWMDSNGNIIIIIIIINYVPLFLSVDSSLIAVTTCRQTNTSDNLGLAVVVVVVVWATRQTYVVYSLT